MDGLPGISTNLLSERLKSLEQQGVLRRRTLPPPAGSTVYELTTLGQGLEETLLELGKWGSQFVPPSPEGASLLHVSSYALTLKTFFRPAEAQGINETYELHIDNEVLQVHVQEGRIHVQQGETSGADVIVHTDMPSYLRLLSGQLQPNEAVEEGLLQVEGDLDAFRHFLKLCGLPGSDEQGRLAT